MSFLLYNAVITRVDAGWAAVVLNLIPAFGLLSAVLFLGEKPTGTTSIGAILIGTSVVYFTISDRRGARGTVTATDKPPNDRASADGRQPAADLISMKPGTKSRAPSTKQSRRRGDDINSPFIYEDGAG